MSDISFHCKICGAYATISAAYNSGTGSVCDDCLFRCMDCGASTYTENYMVRDDLWSAAGMWKGDDRMLCIGCLERRIRRRLTRKDFPRMPLNDDPRRENRRSSRLRERLKAGTG
jgi:hypothetical protein